jgi:hypothetical protein
MERLPVTETTTPCQCGEDRTVIEYPFGTVCAGCGTVRPAPPASTGMETPSEPTTDALDYATRLLRYAAPECRAEPDLMGVLMQIDNALVGLRAVTPPVPETPSEPCPKCGGWTQNTDGHRNGCPAKAPPSLAPPRRGPMAETERAARCEALWNNERQCRYDEGHAGPHGFDHTERRTFRALVKETMTPEQQARAVERTTELLAAVPEAPPASPLSDERLAEIRWLANTGVEGSVAATELRELLAEVDRLRALTRRNDA